LTIEDLFNHCPACSRSYRVSLGRYAP
jgi:hypothetical protein